MLRAHAWIKGCLLTLLGLAWFYTPAFPAIPDETRPHVFIAQYIRGDSLWHVDVYVAFPDAWIAARELQNRPALQLEIQLLDADRGVLQRKQQKVYLRPISDYLSRFPIQTSNFFQVRAGRYHIRLILKNEQEIIWTSEKFALQLNPNGERPIRISDLVPVAYPRIGVPPFDAILWPTLNPMRDDFYLYYEIHSEVPDTFVTMNADLLDSSGRTVRHEQYRLYVGEYSRQDYLRVKIADIPEGEYTLILRAGESGVQKTFRFRVGHAYSVTQQIESARVAWEKNR